MGRGAITLNQTDLVVLRNRSVTAHRYIDKGVKNFIPILTEMIFDWSSYLCKLGTAQTSPILTA